MGPNYSFAVSLAALAGPIGARGKPERAARLLGASEVLLAIRGIGPAPADQADIDRYVAAVRAQLDEATFEAASAEGRAMTVQEAVAYALGETHD
jgi:non-specific serine/threonine protein kinase